MYQKILKIARPEEAKILIDIAKPGNEVDIGFKRLAVEEDKFSSDSEKDQQNEEDHDIDSDAGLRKHYDVGFDIWAIAQSHIKHEYAYLAFIGLWRITIYNVYHDLNNVCEFNIKLDLDYRKKPLLKKYG